MNNYINSFSSFLTKRLYRPRTIETYMDAINSLVEFYPGKQPDEIDFQQIANFISFLANRKKAAPSSVRLYLASFDLFFNVLHAKNFDIKSLKIPVERPKTPEILSSNEIRQLFYSSDLDIKQRVVLTLIYSTGIDASQASRLKVSDIDFKNKRVNIRNSRDKIIRSAKLSETLTPLIQRYLGLSSPDDWLFEGKEQGKPLSTDAILRYFRKWLHSSRINKNVSVRNLKYSYVKHLELYGVPLPIILQEMGIKNSQSIYIYSQIGLTETNLTFSPLDRILYEQSDIQIVTDALEKSFSEIQSIDEKSYLLEAIKCVSARAPRAAVVFAWNAAIRNIQSRCLLLDQDSLNNALQKHYRNAPIVTSINDFEEIKERYVLEACHTLGLFDKREKTVLIGCLDLRNQCGHPGTYMPDEHRVAGFLEDLYKIVFSKPNSVIEKDDKTITSEDDDRPYIVYDDIPF